MFEREDWKLFRSLETIGQKAGVSKALLARLVAKELVDNALDATGQCRIGFLDGSNGFWVEDEGPGVDGTDAEVASLFSIARPLRSSKLLRLPTRGVLGNGLRVVAGTILATRGELSVVTRGRILRLVPRDDGETDAEILRLDDRDGTRIEVTLGPELRVVPDTLAGRTRRSKWPRGRRDIGARPPPGGTTRTRSTP